MKLKLAQLRNDSPNWTNPECDTRPQWAYGAKTQLVSESGSAVHPKLLWGEHLATETEQTVAGVLSAMAVHSCCWLFFNHVFVSKDSKGLSNPSEVEALREKVYASLEAYCKQKYPEQPGRYGHKHWSYTELRSAVQATDREIQKE